MFIKNLIFCLGDFPNCSVTASVDESEDYVLVNRSIPWFCLKCVAGAMSYEATTWILPMNESVSNCMSDSTGTVVVKDGLLRLPNPGVQLIDSNSSYRVTCEVIGAMPQFTLSDIRLITHGE